MEIIDSHCHLFLPEFTDLPDIIQRLTEVGVVSVINVGLDTKTSIEAIKLATREDIFYATVGWHPHETERLRPSDLLDLERLACQPKVVGFGEIGLDFFHENSPKKIQLEAFEALLDSAARIQKPVIIHTREAFEQSFDILKSWRQKLSGLLIHCFTGNLTEAYKWLELDAYLSFPGVISFPKAAYLKEVAKKVPRNRIMIETDAPYLAPVPRRGRRNEPSYLVYHLKVLAEALGLSPSETAAITTANARQLFSLTESR